MTDASARLGLPYILTGQAQKEVTHNEALNRLDAAIQMVVEDRDLTTPPPAPTEAAAYLVASGATGPWAGKDGRIAAYYNGWQFLAPREGWLLWVADEEVLLRHTGTAWAVFASAVGQEVMAAQDAAEIRTRLGLGTAALLNAGNLVALDGSGRLPAVDGSQLTNLPGGGGPMSLDGLTDVDTASTPPDDGQALVWSGAASQWKPGTVSGGGGGSGQPLDADLTALAGLTTTGLVERTGNGTATTVAITAAGKALLDDADAAAQRATLGLGAAATLTPGTAAGALVQLDSSAKLPAVDGSQLTNLPLDTDLAALAALASTGLIERTGNGTATTVAITAAGKALLDDADAAAQRATLGLGTAATLSPGTAAGALVQLDASGKLPAVDGSQLTNLPLDTDLAALAALASTGLIERTGNGTATTVAITAAGKALLDDADAAAQRATLGLGAAATLSPGTAAGALVQLDASGKLPAVDGSQLTNLPSAGGAQPVDPTLTALAGLGNGPNTLPYFTATDSAATTPLTAFARTVLDDGDAATARATLAAAALSSAQTFGGGQRATVTLLIDAATITIDLSMSNDFTLTLGGSRTMANPANAVAGQSGLIALVQDATGNRTLAWAANWDWEGGVAPTLSSAAGAVDVVAYWCRSPTSIVASLAVRGAA